VRFFGQFLHDAGVALSKIVPNLMLYVPERPLLTGEAAGVSLWPYVGGAALHALSWSLVLFGLASLIFRRRDFI
jgi:hypothetical protein